jgi:hypothetical protein
VLVAIHASGIDIINEIKINFKKSVDRMDTMLLTDAPNALRMPISFVRFSADKTDNPNKPIQEIKMVRIALNSRICFHFASAS